MLWRLWDDETAAVVSAELILVLTLLVIVLVVGFDVHDATLEEMADTAQACADSDQSYDYGGASGETSATAGSSFTDAPDFCDGPNTNQRNSRCVIISGPGPLANSGA